MIMATYKGFAKYSGTVSTVKMRILGLAEGGVRVRVRTPPSA